MEQPHWADPPGASNQGGTVIEYLSRAKVAEREGLSINTIDDYVRRGYMPDPDARIGRDYELLGQPVLVLDR
jgi:hypothetical protein